MLTITRINDSVIEIRETIMTFNNGKVSYHYIDHMAWRCSSTGKKDAKIDRDMVPSAIDWAKKYYLPKVL